MRTNRNGDSIHIYTIQFYNIYKSEQEFNSITQLLQIGTGIQLKSTPYNYSIKKESEREFNWYLHNTIRKKSQRRSNLNLHNTIIQLKRNRNGNSIDIYTIQLKGIGNGNSIQIYAM